MAYFPLPSGVASAPLEGITIPPSYDTASANAPPPAYYPPSRTNSSFSPHHTDNELDTSSPRFSATNLRDYTPSRAPRQSSPQRPRQSHPPSHSPSYRSHTPHPPRYRDEDLDTTSPHFSRSALRDYSPRPHSSRRNNLPPPLSLDTSTRALSPSSLPKPAKGTRPYKPYKPGPQNRYSQLASPSYEGPNSRDDRICGRFPRSRNGAIASLVVSLLAVVVVVIVAVRAGASGR